MQIEKVRTQIYTHIAQEDDDDDDDEAISPCLHSQY